MPGDVDHRMSNRCLDHSCEITAPFTNYPLTTARIPGCRAGSRPHQAARAISERRTFHQEQSYGPISVWLAFRATAGNEAPLSIRGRLDVTLFYQVVVTARYSKIFFTPAL